MLNIQEEECRAWIMSDGEYRTLLKECKGLEEEYLRIQAALPQKDREILDRCITVCEELEYRRCVLVSMFKAGRLM